MSNRSSGSRRRPTTQAAGRRRAARAVSLAAVMTITTLAGSLFALPTAAQSGDDPADWSAQAPVETGGLGTGPYADMEMRYERTLFRVDVLQLSLRFDTETAGALQPLVDGGDYDRRRATRVIDRVLDASDVLVRSRFLRDVSIDQFLDGVGDNLRHARRAGLLTVAEQERIEAGTRAHYEPLRARGIRRGETVWYRIRGDRLHTVLQAVDGSALLDLTFEGPEHRRAVLGGYLAPGSDFREGLVRSLFRRAGG